MFRIILYPQCISIVRMHGLINNRIIIQTFHNIYLSSHRPNIFINFIRQSPYSRPCSSRPMQSSSYFDASPMKACLSLSTIPQSDTSPYLHPYYHSQFPLILNNHHAFHNNDYQMTEYLPIRSSARYAAPYCGIRFRTIKIIFPH